MQQIEQLEFGNYYHIYNRGIDSCNLFFEPENYEYFLGIYDKYISPIADTFAWVLMPNHFHFSLRIKGKEEIAAITSNLTGLVQCLIKEFTLLVGNCNPDLLHPGIQYCRNQEINELKMDKIENILYICFGIHNR